MIRPVAAAVAAAMLLFTLPSAARAQGPFDRPYILHLPGIGGRMRVDRNMTAGLADAIPDADIQTYDWTCHDPGLDALLARPRNQQQAKLVAALITQHRREHPDQVIDITSHSGGTGIAVWALEDLPDDVHVDTVLLLASALSPDYDLSKALRHVDHAMIAVTSTLDAAVLGLGTRTFGTIDGVKTDAAGRVGFSMPPGADAAQYRKLVAMPYDARWMQLNNLGDHIGPMSRPFARVMLAPLLTHRPLPVLPDINPPTTAPALAAGAPATQPAGR